MGKVLMCKGLPASGKSTEARGLVEHGRYKRLNRDDLRAMLDNGQWSPKNERTVVDMEKRMVRDMLARGYDVIIDDCNLNPKNEVLWTTIAKECGADFEILDFTYVPLDVCIARDAGRPGSVGEDVIRRMYEQYLMPMNKVGFDSNLPRCLIVDMDGTLALHTSRGPFEYERCDEDAPNTHVIQMVKLMAIHEDMHVVVCSGREDIGNVRAKTANWLKFHGVVFTDLFMRPASDHRKDAIVKREILENQILPKYYPTLVIDDRQQVVDMWRDAGLECWQVAQGRF